MLRVQAVASAFIEGQQFLANKQTFVDADFLTEYLTDVELVAVDIDCCEARVGRDDRLHKIVEGER